MKTVSEPFHPLSALRRLGLSAAVLLLAACGGGGGDGSAAGTATRLSSFYSGTSGGRDFWALAASPAGGSQPFFAVSHLGTALQGSAAQIYSGTAILGVQGQATVSPLRAFLEDARLRTGSAALSNVSATGMAASVILNDLSAPEARASYSATRVAPVDALAGTWSGRWLDGGGSNAAFSFTAPATGASTLITPLAGCPGIELGFGAFDAGTGLYRVTLKYPNEEQCLQRDSQSLSGLAAVHGSGLTQELRFVAVDAAGSGIVFVGLRAPPP